MLNWLLRLGPLSGYAERFGGSAGGDLASLTAAMKEEMDKKKGDQPLSRLQDAFKQLKDMHKDDPRLAEGLMQSPQAASAFDNAHWPYGPGGAPSQAQASVPMPQPRPQMATAPAAVPMPAPRPAEAPQASSPFADFFARNTAMMKDPTSGEFIDPSAAAKQGGGILNGLFG